MCKFQIDAVGGFADEELKEADITDEKCESRNRVMRQALGSSREQPGSMSEYRTPLTRET